MKCLDLVTVQHLAVGDDSYVDDLSCSSKETSEEARYILSRKLSVSPPKIKRTMVARKPNVQILSDLSFQLLVPGTHAFSLEMGGNASCVAADKETSQHVCGNGL